MPSRNSCTPCERLNNIGILLAISESTLSLPSPDPCTDAFALAGYFLERRVFDQRGEGMPEQRRRLIERLGFAGRL